MNTADVEAIRMLTARYAHCLDRNRIEALVALFTADAVFDETRVGLGIFDGREEIARFFEHDAKVMDKQVHYATNFVLDRLEGDEASGACYFLAQGITRSGGEIYATGFYEDEYRREGGQWLFARRTVHPFLPPKLDAFEVI